VRRFTEVEIAKLTLTIVFETASATEKYSPKLK
jgi:hypothetical protein